MKPRLLLVDLPIASANNPPTSAVTMPAPAKVHAGREPPFAGPTRGNIRKRRR